MTTALPTAGSLARPAATAGSAALGLLRTRILGAPTVSHRRKAVAFTIAAIADVVQLVLWPAFAEGAASPFEDALDVVVALTLLLTLGFSARLALAFALELVPGADLFPTWTAVVASIPSADPLPPAKAPAE